MIRCIAAAIATGIALTVAVSWVLTALPGSRHGMGGWVLTRGEVPAWLVIPSKSRTMILVISELITETGRLQRNLHLRQRPPSLIPAIPGWARPSRLDPAAVAAGQARACDLAPALWETATGWPWPAMRAAFHDQWSGELVVERGLFVPWLHDRDEPPGGEEHCILPTAPIWPGFIGNAAVYAATTFLLISARPWARGWRQRLRQRRGLCTQCAYPMPPNSAVCPECGAAITRSAPAPGPAPGAR